MVLVGGLALLGAGGSEVEILDVELAFERELPVLLREGESRAGEPVAPGPLGADSEKLGESSVMIGHLKRTTTDQPRMTGT